MFQAAEQVACALGENASILQGPFQEIRRIVERNVGAHSRSRVATHLEGNLLDEHAQAMICSMSSWMSFQSLERSMLRA